jgi:hypothetical protein
MIRMRMQIHSEESENSENQAALVEYISSFELIEYSGEEMELLRGNSITSLRECKS